MATRVPIEVANLRDGFLGEILTPGDSGYDTVRPVWNAMIDRRPDVIARCAGTDDAVRVVNFARDRGIPLAVRGAGHNIGGKGTCDGGVLLDLSGMTAVRVNPESRTARVAGGATLGDVDAATLVHGLAVPTGINSTTGIGGLTLGGGIGWLTRKHGLTADSLLSAEVVTASGDVVHASASSHEDLFWALRGGSGNFGAVTSFEFRLHTVGPDLLSGLFVYPLSEGLQVLRAFGKFMTDAPDEMTIWAVLRLAPPLPFLPDTVHGSEVVVLAFAYAGDPRDGEAVIRPMADFGTVLGSAAGVQPFVEWQQAFDPLLTPGARNYWKSHNLETLADGALEAAIGAVRSLPVPQCDLLIAAVGGAAARIRSDETAYPHRDTRFVMNIHGRWEDAKDDGTGVGWTRSTFDAVVPFATGGVYVNFEPDDDQERIRAAYGSNYDRLVRVKGRYDPSNLFSTNLNIAPA